MINEEKGVLFIRKWSCSCRIEDGFSAKIGVKSGRTISVKIRSNCPQHLEFFNASKADADMLKSSRFNVSHCDLKEKILFLSEI